MMDLRGSTTTVAPFAQGEQLGFDDEVSGSILPGSDSSPESDCKSKQAKESVGRLQDPKVRTASQNANPNADLVDPATGQVVSRTPEAQRALDRQGATPPPAADYNDSGAE